MEKCPSCGNDLKHVGKSQETVNGHHARKFECNNSNCHRETVLGGFA